MAGSDFKSTLLLENLRADVPLTFVPTLILASGEVPLDKVTVPAHSTTSIDISGFLQQHAYFDQRGTVAVKFDFSTYGPGMAVVESVDETHGIYLNSYAASAEEYWAGNTYDAVVWTPQESTDGFIAITNTSADTHAVQLSFIVNGRSEKQPTINVAARHTHFLSIKKLLLRSPKSGVGIHVEVEQDAEDNYAGAILVEGQLFDKKTGFAKHIHFMDKALQFPTGTLRSGFLLLGTQPPEDGYPLNISFHSVAVVRNLDVVPVKVSPTVRFLRDGAVQTVSLPAVFLAINETRLIDFSEAQRAGLLPSDLHQGNVELAPDTDRVSVVGELVNFSQTGGYVVGPSFTSYPSRSTASIWRTDGTFQTSIMVENTAPNDDRVTLKLFSDSGTYTKTFDIAAGGLLKIGVKNIQQNGIKDDSGNLLSGTSGVFHIMGGHNTDSKLSYEKIIHSDEEGDYVGLPPNQCDYVEAIFLVVDDSSGILPFPIWTDLSWAFSGEEWTNMGWGNIYSSDASVAQVGANSDSTGAVVSFTPPADGQDHTVTFNYSGLLGATSCDACSGWTFPVVSVSLKVRISVGSYHFTGMTPDGFQCVYKLSCPSGTCTCGTQIPSINVPAGSCTHDWLIDSRLAEITSTSKSCFFIGKAAMVDTPVPCL